jgi:hypothetical protein
VSVLIFVDGIIRKERDQSVIVDGVNLYRSLNETNRVLLLAKDRERTDIWLKTNNMAKKLDDIIGYVDNPIDDARYLTVESLRSKGKIDFVVTDDTELALRFLEVSIPVLMFLNPKYTRPEFRPDAREGVKSWSKITEELDKQQGLYLEDPRTEN